MNRAFISLYGFIVASVLLLGWGLNHFWDRLAPEPPVSQEVRSLLALIDLQLNAGTDPAELARQLSAQHASLQLLPLDELASSGALAQLQAGDILRSADAQQFSYYQLASRGGQVIILSLPAPPAPAPLLQRLLLGLFYAGLALAIFLWVWPLSRDAKKLEQQTRQLGKDGLPQNLRIAPSSALYPLARAFNLMAQRLRELLSSHRDMTNAVSHELRTPLARMKFALALIDTGALDDKSRRQLASLEQDVAEMESLIGSLLMYAGFERQGQQLNTRPGDMADLFAELQLRFARTNQRPVQLELHLQAPTSNCECEWKLIETVLHNALGNAARYARERIRLEWLAARDEYLIAIEDDGPGIAPAERARVFESFVRLYPEGEAASGFGLGLAIIQRILHWHGGEARFVDPQHLGGARLELRWPCNRNQTDPGENT